MKKQFLFLTLLLSSTFMKKFKILLLIIVVSLNVSSQVKFSLSAGTVNAMIEDLPFTGFGYHGGITTIIPLNKQWSFLPEIRLLNIDYHKNNYIKETKLIEIPLSIEYKTKLKRNNFFKLNFGGFGNYTVGGTDTYYYSGKMEGNVFIEPPYQRTSVISNSLGIGVLFGFGLEINRLYLGIEPNFRYNEDYGSGMSINTKLAYRL